MHFISESEIQKIPKVKTEEKFGKLERNVKLELIEILRKSNIVSKRYNLALNAINWDFIHIEGYSTKQLQFLLQEIITDTSHLRTLDEMFSDFERNGSKKSRPKRPTAAMIDYVRQNLPKIKDEVEKLYPDKKIGFVRDLKT